VPEEMDLRQVVYSQAIRTALREEMKRDERVVLWGEDIGVYGGVYGATTGLQREFGKERVRDAPISEMAIVGAAVGAALLGMRPVVEIMYEDFLMHAADGLANQAAKWRYMSGGQFEVPLVVRSPGGGGSGYAAQHSQNIEAWFAHIPGLTVIAPCMPRDARGLLKSAIRDPNPVLFLEHKSHYTHKGPVPKEEELIPIGVADVKREGTDVTLVSYSRTLLWALEAAEMLAAEGVSVEVIDPRTLVPLDMETILASVRKTGRLVIAHEAHAFCGFGAEIAAQVSEKAWGSLKAPPRRLGSRPVPLPYSEPLESYVLVDAADIVGAVREVLEG
jgi:pyruvate/2-oxoglutarate/acetoin dehydrogenase E1 component